ncbi:MAG: hypothetical protein QW613_06135 [Thermoprotei archaeon]
MILEEGLAAHTTELNLFELSYLICRKAGWQKASAVVEALRNSGYLQVHDTHPYLEAAAKLKCERPISIVECITIAAEEALSLPVLFARHE